MKSMRIASTIAVLAAAAAAIHNYTLPLVFLPLLCVAYMPGNQQKCKLKKIIEPKNKNKVSNTRYLKYVTYKGPPYQCLRLPVCELQKT